MLHIFFLLKFSIRLGNISYKTNRRAEYFFILSPWMYLMFSVALKNPDLSMLDQQMAIFGSLRLCRVDKSFLEDFS